MKFTKDNQGGSNGFQELPEKLLLKSARAIDPVSGKDQSADILIEDGKITAIEPGGISGVAGEQVDLDGKVVSPGWIDMHVHLREPGREDEETIKSGTAAAANGGFTAVCCMPNTSPAIDTQEIIQYIKDRTKRALVDVHPIAAITKKQKGEELSEILELVEEGAVAISDDHKPLMSSEVMRRALEYSTMAGIPVVSYAEDATMSQKGQVDEGYISTCLGLGGLPSVSEEIMISRDIMLAEYTRARLHIAHITTVRGIDLVRQAKARGIQVTAEATPHHMTLVDEAVRSFDTNLKIKPPLRTEDDRAAIIAGLKDGTIDAIATDHSPHAWEEKASEFIHAPFGIIGLETSMGLSISCLVKNNKMKLIDFLHKVAVNPYQILNMEPPRVEAGAVANLTIFDAKAKWEFDVAKSRSRSTNTPFSGQVLHGKPFAVINNQRMFYSDL